MLKKLCMRLLLSFFLSVSAVVHADVFHLQFNDEIFGGHQTLDMQNVLHDQYQVDANQLSIEKIDVIVKSWFGGGLVWLGSRYSQSDRRFVNGQATNFNNPADWTFNQISFPVSGTNSGLQLNLNGQFKLREVIVYTASNIEADNLLLNSEGEAQIILPMHHLELSGLNSIDLKQLLHNDTHLNPDEYHLNGIVVALKSRLDGAQAWLESGELLSNVVLVQGSMQAYDDRDPATYNYTSINTRQYDNQSPPWLLKLKGDIRLYEIVVKLKNL